jgi:hypothetical protein
MVLEDLGLGDRVYDLLSSTGYQTVGDLILQIELDEDAVLGISGIGPKAMEDIHQRLANLSFPEEKVSEPVEVVPALEAPVEVGIEIAPVEAVVLAAEPEATAADIVQLPSVEPAISEQAALAATGAEAAEEIVGAVVGGESGASAEAQLPADEAATQVKSSEFDDLFSIKPGEIGYNVTGEDEEEEDGEQKPGTKKSKKKKKRFVEVEYDPDRDVTLVKRKRKRDGTWGDDWEF